MALDFPNPPLTNGQQFDAPNGVTYVWDGVKWTVPGGGGSVGGDVTIQSLAVAPTVNPPDISSSRIGLNLYQDSTGNWHYLANGPGAAIFMRPQSPAGPESRLAIEVADLNTAGADAPVAATMVGAFNILAGAPGSGAANPWVLIGAGTDVPAVMPRRGTLLAEDLIVRPDPVNPADRVARFGLNAIANVTDASWYYVDAGPAAVINTHEVTIAGGNAGSANLRFSVLEPGAAGAPLPIGPAVAGLIVYGAAGTAVTNQTSIALLVNSTGTPVLAQVQIGAVDSGGTGFRVLVVPN